MDVSPWMMLYFLLAHIASLDLILFVFPIVVLSKLQHRKRANEPNTLLLLLLTSTRLVHQNGPF